MDLKGNKMINKTIKKRVYDIYVVYRDAVECDGVLLAIYENYFGKISHQNVASIKRIGRYWRNKMPYLFYRTAEKQNQDQQTTKEVLECVA